MIVAHSHNSRLDSVAGFLSTSMISITIWFLTWSGLDIKQFQCQKSFPPPSNLRFYPYLSQVPIFHIMQRIIVASNAYNTSSTWSSINLIVSNMYVDLY